jgi:hypothetical protein
MSGIATSHAISRAIERGAAENYDDAVAKLSTAFIRKAIEFGASEIILGTGHHAVVSGGVIVTVRPRAKAKRRRWFRENDDG